jgi:pyruvate,water dikinase
MEMLRKAVTGTLRNGRPGGICGEAPTTDPEVAADLVGWGETSVSVNPFSLMSALGVVTRAEANLGRGGPRALATVAGRDRSTSFFPFIPAFAGRGGTE